MTMRRRFLRSTQSLLEAESPDLALVADLNITERALRMW